MPKLKVHNESGKAVGSYQIEPTDLAPRISRQLLHDAAVMYQANRRQGSARTRTRGEIAYSTRKLYRQKGTGNARAGARSSGVRRGGGHIFAKRPRDFSYRLPRKALQLATRMAVAAKVRDGELLIIDSLEFASPKTQRMAAILKALECDGHSLLVTTSQHDTNVYKSARNIDSVEVAPATELNAHAVLSNRRMLITRDALDSLKKRAAEATQVDRG